MTAHPGPAGGSGVTADSTRAEGSGVTADSTPADGRDDAAPPLRPTDLRLALPAAAAWLAAALALPRPAAALPLAGIAALAGALLLCIGRSAVMVTTAAAVLCVAAAATTAGLRAESARPALLRSLAEAGGSARLELVVTGDPAPVSGQSGRVAARRLVRLDARVVRIAAGGRSATLRAPVLVLAPASGWAALLPGQPVTTWARLAASAPGDLLGAVVFPRGPPYDVGSTTRAQRAAGAVRAGLRRAVEPLPAGPEALLPGLVIGDTSRLPPEVVADFKATGLTHLVAVSGANLAIVVGTVVTVTRRLGAGRRFAGVLGALALIGFVVVARPSPSVLRAAAMGLVVIVGLHRGRRSVAVPSLAAATLGILLVDPSMARAPGFALSVLATGGIVLLAAPLRDRIPAAVPRWLAEATAVPLAAQIACAPLLVALFGRLSLIAIPANVLVAPAVPPATLLGAVAAVLAPVLLPVAEVVARIAGPPTGWLLLVAERGASVPGAEIGWPTGGVGAALVISCALAAAAALRVRALRRVVAAAAAGALLAGLGTHRIAPGWPPPGWAFAVCDVGQGDALVLATGSGSGVVVDAGPDAHAVDRCLRELGVRRVPLVVLSHLHADHVDGLPGVLRNRAVGAIQVGPLDEPSGEWLQVRRLAVGAGIPIIRATPGERRSVGPIGWQVIAPRRPFAGTESDPNNSSLVLHVALPGFTALLTGDIEIAAQQDLLDAGTPLAADVLKIPHHGSRRQLPELLRRVRSRFAIASVAAGNDYGHPSAATMTVLAAAGAHVLRTDRDGSVAFLRRGSNVVAVGRRGTGIPPAEQHVSGLPPPATTARGSRLRAPTRPSGASVGPLPVPIYRRTARRRGR